MTDIMNDINVMLSEKTLVTLDINVVFMLVAVTDYRK